VFQNNTKKLVKDAIYYGRIEATNLYFQKSSGRSRPIEQKGRVPKEIFF
jgi:hypothetical protein